MIINFVALSNELSYKVNLALGTSVIMCTVNVVIIKIYAQVATDEVLCGLMSCNCYVQ